MGAVRLDEGLRSGLFLSGVRRTGKTTFLLNDLIPFIGTGSHRALVNELTARRRGPHHCHRSPLPPGANPDEHLPVIAATLRSTAADIELTNVEQLGGLATAIFERVAASDGDVRGVFSSEAAAEYTKAIGREVRIEEIQPVVNDLLASNLIMRRGHGMYGVTDPFVQQIWREKKAAPWGRAFL